MWNVRDAITRRRFGTVMGSLAAPLVLWDGCDSATPLSNADDGRLSVRPKSGVKTTANGTTKLGLAPGRDATLQMPSVIPSGPMPLHVSFHGAGSEGGRMLQRLGAAADAAGVALLAPDSRGATWDAVDQGRGIFGVDIAYLDRALAKVFEMVAVDPARLSIGGFSDGATYGVSLGLINGDLFPRVVALSPGFVIGRVPHGKPQIFISHGTADNILPIDQCGRVVAQGLRDRQYTVTFREFPGTHEVPPAIATEAMNWAAAPKSAQTIVHPVA